MKYLSIIVFTFVLFACDTNAPTAPERKTGIPENAVWAGGVDGGAWILCNRIGTEQYSCTIYNEFTGSIMAKGVFLHRKIFYDVKTKELKIQPASNTNTLPSYNYYDGEFIKLKGEEALVPDGEVIWPFDEEHGKKQYFKNGIAVGQEVQY